MGAIGEDEMIPAEETPTEVEAPEAAAEELQQWRQLFEYLTLGKSPLLPQPDWCQDVAFVASMIDELNEHVKNPA